MSRPLASFTIKAGGLLNQIRIKVMIHPLDESGKSVEAVALWDTGATRTCISKRLAGLMGVAPVGYGIAHTANGQCQTEEYLIRLEMKNRVITAPIRSSTFNGSADVDVLIGMDIITAGDFSITNANGKTYVSFRIPPDYRHIDYTVASKKDKAGKLMNDHLRKNQAD